MYDEHGTSGAHPRRLVSLLLTGVIAVAFIGFLVGIDYGVPRHDFEGGPAVAAGSFPGRVSDHAAEEGIPARSYADIRAHPLGPTRERVVSVDDRVPTMPDPSTVIEIDLDARRASLATRASRRAYNGAPPVIPHAVDAIDGRSCVVCHQDGFRAGTLSARAMPHPYYENCTQCHAPPAPSALGDVDPGFAANGFRGVAAPFEGARASTGAPPTIPHSTWMRDNCLACHGPGGWPGMETTHPWRRACLQCHAPSAELDQRPGGTRASFLPPLQVSSR